MSIMKFIRPTALTFIGRQQVAPDTYTFTFRPDVHLDRHAGQHGMIELRPAKGSVKRRMFSLSSAPRERTVSITTRWLGDGVASKFKNSLWALQPGDKAKLRGPVGPMYVRNPLQHNIFIASGIGITPFRAMLAEAVMAGQDLHGTLIYVNHDEAKIIFKNELEKLSSKLKHFEVKLITEPQQITEDIIRLSTPNLATAMFYLAGSPSTIKGYKKLLKELGIKPSQIKNDPFYGYK